MIIFFLKNKGGEKMDSMQCLRCQKIIIPKVTRGAGGMHSLICPLCGANVENVLNQDVSQITFKTSPKAALIILGIIALLAVLAIVFIR